MENEKYFLYRYVDDRTGEVVYIGKSKDAKCLRGRILAHSREPQFADFVGHCHIEYAQVGSREEMDVLEWALIHVHAPEINRMWCPKEPVAGVTVPEPEWARYEDKCFPQKKIASHHAASSVWTLSDLESRIMYGKKIYGIIFEQGDHPVFYLGGEEAVRNCEQYIRLWINIATDDEKYSGSHCLFLQLWGSEEDGWALAQPNKGLAENDSYYHLLAPLRKQINAWVREHNDLRAVVLSRYDGDFDIPILEEMGEETEQEKRLAGYGIAVDLPCEYRIPESKK